VALVSLVEREKCRTYVGLGGGARGTLVSSSSGPLRFGRKGEEHGHDTGTLCLRCSRSGI
jgi:hypothetical protein